MPAAVDQDPLTLNMLHDQVMKNAKFDLLKLVRYCIATGKSFEVSALNYGTKILRVYGAPVMLRTDRILGTVIMIEDVTEQKLVERSKDEFFSIASHELRTPLTAIRGNTALIKDYFSEQLKDPNLKEMIEDIHQSSVRLIGIVNDFLDVSRLEQGKMKFNFEVFQFEDVVEDIIYDLGAVGKEKHLQLAFKNTKNSLPPIYADKNRVKQIVYNMVGNAMKFTTAGGITLWAEPVNGMLKVYIQDTGLGISPEGQRLLFRKFQQTGASILTRDSSHGTGLGLYISKLLVEKMNGAIWLAASEVNKGSTFCFTLPLATISQLKQQSNPGAPILSTPR